MNISLSIRIAAVFEIMLASLIGICFPLVVNTDNNSFRVLNACSAGVMLGLALIHLLPDANDILIEQFPDYNWAFVLTAVGVILVLAIEQAVFVLASNVNEEVTKSQDLVTIHHHSHDHSAKSYKTMDYDGHDHGHGHSHDHNVHNESCGITHCVHTDNVTKQRKPPVEVFHCTQPKHSHKHFPTAAPSSSCGHANEEGSYEHAEEAQVFVNVLQSSGLKALITAYVMEISIAVHSIIIGVDLGLLSKSGEVPTLISLLIALSFHQFIEGVGLGSTIQASRASLGNAKVVGFVVIFSCTMPLGILMGILTSTDRASNSQLVAKGVANALAAGSLLYISLTEMVGNYFHAHDLAKKPLVKLCMVLSFATGVLLMAVIAIWA